MNADILAFRPRLFDRLLMRSEAIKPPRTALGAEFVGMSFADARDRGVSEARLQAFQDADQNYRKVLLVFRRLGGSSAASQLRDGGYFGRGRR